MRRCSLGYLNGWNRSFPTDPDAVTDELDGLLYSREFDASLLVQLDPNDVLQNRLRMKLALSRYGRISPEYWEDRDLQEMKHSFDILIQMLKNEGSPTENQ